MSRLQGFDIIALWATDMVGFAGWLSLTV